MKIFLLIFLLSGCLMKKEVVIPEEAAPLSVVSRGLFVVDKQLYFSDGGELYCGFKDWKHFNSLSKELKKSEQPPIVIKKEPEMMKSVFHCNKELFIEPTDKSVRIIRR